MGEWFTSFESAWEAFLRRDDPLESFWSDLPDDPGALVDAWLIVPPPDLKRAVLRVQGGLEDVRGLRIVPHHFLHVTLPHVHELEEPFEVSVNRVNCFPAAIVAEVESDRLDRLDVPETFLPHVSLAYVERPVDPGPVRAAVSPLRDAAFGSFVVGPVTPPAVVDGVVSPPPPS